MHSSGKAIGKAIKNRCRLFGCSANINSLSLDQAEKNKYVSYSVSVQSATEICYRMNYKAKGDVMKQAAFPATYLTIKLLHTLGKKILPCNVCCNGHFSSVIARSRTLF